MHKHFNIQNHLKEASCRKQYSEASFLQIAKPIREYAYGNPTHNSYQEFKFK